MDTQCVLESNQREKVQKLRYQKSGRKKMILFWKLKQNYMIFMNCPTPSTLSWQDNHKIYADKINGLVQDCGISSANALEISQSWTKPSKFRLDGNKQISKTWINNYIPWDVIIYPGPTIYSHLLPANP